MLDHHIKRRLSSDILNSKLYYQNTFYKAFLRDLNSCTTEAIIESPYITTKRIDTLLPTLRKLSKRGVRIVINTRNPNEHEGTYKQQAENAIANLQELNILVLYTAGLHRKLTILDRIVIWEGSLNILSQNDSCEIMRRTKSKYISKRSIEFTGLNNFI